MAFHQLLRDYINGGCSVWRRNVNFKNATAVCLGYSYQGTRRGVDETEIRLSNYSGTDRNILALRDFLQPIATDLYSVILHGSVGDGHTTGYSDVDALVIIRNDVFADPTRLSAVATKLSAARIFMYRFDPLQHHGWFAMTEQDLAAYPESVLPLEAIREGCVLSGEPVLRVSSLLQDCSVYEVAARRMVNKLHYQLRDGWRPKNAYQLKSLLSEFMMLPVLYLQTIYGKGYSKRDSFRDARTHYSESVWQAMEDVSNIRRHWKYIPGYLSAQILSSRLCLLYPIRKYWPSAIPNEVAPLVNDDFYGRLLTFVEETDALLDEIGQKA